MRRHLLADVLKVTSGLHSDQEERHEHLDAIAGVIEQRRVWELHGWLHENLCILDDKANAILTLDSIGLATLTFLFSSFTHATPVVLRVAVIAAALLLLWSIIPLARISFVYWSTTADFREPEAMLNDLLLVRDKRTAIVRASLIKDLAALLVLLLGFVVGGAAWLLARPHG
jgi:hypothetical protein